MQEFVKLIEDRLTGVISTKNVCSILAAAIDLKTPPLVESCISYIFLWVVFIFTASVILKTDVC